MGLIFTYIVNVEITLIRKYPHKALIMPYEEKKLHAYYSSSESEALEAVGAGAALSAGKPP